VYSFNQEKTRVEGLMCGEVEYAQGIWPCWVMLLEENNVKDGIIHKYYMHDTTT
jgi:hypothetical protein